MNKEHEAWLLQQLADLDATKARLAETEAENSRLVAANKARDEFLRGHRYKRSEVDQYIDLCESQIADWRKVADERSAEIVRLSAQLAEAEAQRDKMREALLLLLPGLVLDLRYADIDDDKEAMEARIQTVTEALSAADSATHREDERE